MSARRHQYSKSADISGLTHPAMLSNLAADISAHRLVHRRESGRYLQALCDWGLCYELGVVPRRLIQSRHFSSQYERNQPRRALGVGKCLTALCTGQYRRCSDARLAPSVGDAQQFRHLWGLFIGKPLGIVLFSVLAVKLGLSQWPSDVSWKHMSAPDSWAASALRCRSSSRSWPSAALM